MMRPGGQGRFLVIEVSGFCEDRLVVLMDPEGPVEELATDVLTLAVNMCLPADKVRVVIFKEDEIPPEVQVEEVRYVDPNVRTSAEIK
jgi:hypothetical protein